MTRMEFVAFDPPTSGEEYLHAACSLAEGELKRRLAEWVALRERSVGVRQTPNGAVMELANDEPLDGVARLVDLESACCGFYRFSLRVTGGKRELEIDAGRGGGEAVAALLSIG